MYFQLSLLPGAWSIEKITSEFNCSKYAAKLAKKLRQQSDYQIKYEADEVQHRQRVNPSVIKHFITWLVESGGLITGSSYYFLKIEHTVIHNIKSIW